MDKVKPKKMEGTNGERKMAEYIRLQYDLSVTPVIVNGATGAMDRKIYTGILC